MEKYASNLEALVEEKTDQLREEKKKTEEILLQMLPRSQMACGVLAATASPTFSKTVRSPHDGMRRPYGDRKVFCSPQGLTIF